MSGRTLKGTKWCVTCSRADAADFLRSSSASSVAKQAGSARGHEPGLQPARMQDTDPAQQPLQALRQRRRHAWRLRWRRAPAALAQRSPAQHRPAQDGPASLHAPTH